MVADARHEIRRNAVGESEAAVSVVTLYGAIVVSHLGADVDANAFGIEGRAVQLILNEALQLILHRFSVQACVLQGVTEVIQANDTSWWYGLIAGAGAGASRAARSASGAATST
ncbi:hypothetical protein EAH72_33000 [Pseudomonas caspiana]|nr:hypothetical protein [Pseudomonas caspiana]TPG88539.1 hypothetical protein EAH72_33000 [Pseudomonas caspiana]